MWRDWTNGILGIWTIVLAFLGIPYNTKAILLIITGIVIAFLSFWKGVSRRVADMPTEQVRQNNKERKEVSNLDDVQRPIDDNQKTV